MTPSLRIIAADNQPEMRAFYQEAVPGLGHQLLCIAQTGRELIDLCREHGPDLVISGGSLPDMEAEDAAEQVCQEKLTPFIITIGQFDQQHINRDEDGNHWTYLVKPVQRTQLGLTILLVFRHFERLEAVRRELESLRLRCGSDEQGVST